MAPAGDDSLFAPKAYSKSLKPSHAYVVELRLFCLSYIKFCPILPTYTHLTLTSCTSFRSYLCCLLDFYCSKSIIILFHLSYEELDLMNQDFLQSTLAPKSEEFLSLLSRGKCKPCKEKIRTKLVVSVVRNKVMDCQSFCSFTLCRATKLIPLEC